MTAPLEFDGERLRILDQTRLPHEEVVLTLETPEQVAEAIKRLSVRGAPLIGIAAAYGRAMADDVPRAAEILRGARPTAVNLAWAVDRMVAAGGAVEEADRIRAEDEAASEALSKHGADAL